jgi:hypothetical protein
MPNYCTNKLRVSGEISEVKRFRDAITKGEMKEYEQFRILDNLLPTPEELSNTPKGSFGESDKQKTMEEQNQANITKFGYKDWYDWNCANYGSKWSDFDGVINLDSEGHLELAFMTAWSPIVQGVIHISKQFPTTDFLLTYEEGGMGFMGGVAVRDGELLNSVEGEYPYMECDSDDDYEEMYERVETVMDLMQGQLEEAF